MVAQIEVSDGLYTLESIRRYSCPKGAKSILCYSIVRLILLFTSNYIDTLSDLTLVPASERTQRASKPSEGS